MLVAPIISESPYRVKLVAIYQECMQPAGDIYAHVIKVLVQLINKLACQSQHLTGTSRANVASMLQGEDTKIAYTPSHLPEVLECCCKVGLQAMGMEIGKEGRWHLDVL